MKILEARSGQVFRHFRPGHAAKAVNASPAECVMVGDSIKRDMAGAAGVGMKIALISAAAKPPKAGQHWTLRSVTELEAALG